jgi:hypothetical protein
MARAPARVPAATSAAYNRLTAIALAGVGASALVSWFLGTKPTTDQSTQGISNTTLVALAAAAVAVYYIGSRGE